jgi:hypothetical protein
MDPRTVLVLTLAVAATTASVPAAETGLEKGARIRLSVDGMSRSVQGRLESETEDVIVVRTGSAKHPLVRVPRSSVDSIAVAVPRRGGLAAGVLAGATFWAIPSGRAGALGGACLGLPGAWASSATVSGSGNVLLGVLAGTVASGAVGLGLGALSASGDGWFSGSEMIAIGAAVGAVTGAVSATAAAAWTRPRWTPVGGAKDVRFGVVSMRHGAAAQVSVRF